MVESIFHRKLRERIVDQIESRGEYLSMGGAQDYSSYKETVGYVRGLRDVLKLCEEIEQENE